ncbi:hypothetical protein MKY96_09275 [Paenibacillus sp. FSL R7-0302]|uniref:hypothetical protein n=1 Tax=Paenibacillus sp. FSL R7-0302 TaxID=2921681 RepID=UPI0030F97EA0
MRKKNYLYVLACFMLLLVGCTSQEYKDRIKSGQEAMAAKDYKKAINDFQEASELESKKTDSSELLHQAQSAQKQAIRNEIAIAITNHKAFIDKQEWDQSIKVINDIKVSLLGYEASFTEEIAQLDVLHKNSLAGKEIAEGKELLKIQLFDEALKHFETSQSMVDSVEAQMLMSETLKQKSVHEEEQKRLAFAIKNNVYKFEMSDSSAQQSYDVYLFSNSEKIQTNDLAWACAMEGDRLYSGIYDIATVKQGTTDVKFYSIGERQINYDNKEVFIVKGKPDLFAVSTCESSNFSTVSYWYIHNDELTMVKSSEGDEGFNILKENIKSAGINKYQSVAYYNAGDISWVFDNWILNVDKGILSHEKALTYTWQRFEEGQNQFNRFKTEKDYIVIK